MNKIERQTSPLARNVRRLGHLDLPGAGQVCLSGSHAYVGHIPNAEHRGTSIVDVSDPKQPARGGDHHARRSRVRTATRRASSATS